MEPNGCTTDQGKEAAGAPFTQLLEEEHHLAFKASVNVLLSFRTLWNLLTGCMFVPS